MPEPCLPNNDAHFSKGQENQRFAEGIQADAGRCEREWGVIIRFYAALHFIEAYLSTKSAGTTSHTARRRAIRTRTELARLEDPYNDLYNLGSNARYLVLPCPTEHVFKAHELLLKIRKEIEGLL